MIFSQLSASGIPLLAVRGITMMSHEGTIASQITGNSADYSVRAKVHITGALWEKATND